MVCSFSPRPSAEKSGSAGKGLVGVLGASGYGRGGQGAAAAGVRVANYGRRARGRHYHHVIVDGGCLAVAEFVGNAGEGR